MARAAMTTLPSFRFRTNSAALLALSIFSIADAQTPARLDPPVKPTVSGKFIGNGKSAAIKFVIVEERDPFSDQEAVRLIFSEKDPASVKKPSFDAPFGKLGSALVLSVHHDGGIFGCEVSHSAHEKRGFSSVGEIKMAEFKIAGGNVTGHVVTGKELDAFGEKWEVDLTFAAPLPEKLRNPPAAALKPVADAPGKAPKLDKKAAKPATGPPIAARKLALPGDATDVEFKQIVNQIQFSSARPVDVVAKEFSANLKKQGWKDGAGSLMGKKSAILMREQGAAKLTIMVQPAPSGSVVKMFTEGLDWSGGDDAPPSAIQKSTGDSTADDIEAQVRKRINDALKNLPKLP